MTLRNYSNNAPPQALTADLAASSGATTANVASTSGYPTPPFITGLERGTDNQEVALCTATTGTTLTLIRGYNGTSPLLHYTGSTLEHTSAAIDYSEPNAFINLMTTLGDILVLGPTLDATTGTYVTRLGVGANGQSLTANSSAPNGLDWEQTIPPGTIVAYGGSGAPAGWVKCDGTSYVTSGVYANLYAALGGSGSPWGVTSGHFNVPNLQGMVPIGVGTGTDVDSATKAITLATLYGEYNHVLSGAESPIHNHSFGANTGTESAAHAHPSINGYEPIVQAGGTYGRVVGGTGDAQAATGATTGTENATHTHYVSGTTGNAGSGSGHNNVQPGKGVTYIIKL